MCSIYNFWSLESVALTFSRSALYLFKRMTDGKPYYFGLDYCISSFSAFITVTRKVCLLDVTQLLMILGCWQFCNPQTSTIENLPGLLSFLKVKLEEMKHFDELGSCHLHVQNMAFLAPLLTFCDQFLNICKHFKLAPFHTVKIVT